MSSLSRRPCGRSHAWLAARGPARGRLRRTRAIAAAAGSLVCAAGALAQPQPLAPPARDVVVTASRIEQDLAGTLADVTVIGRERIEAAGAVTVAEVLRNAGGIEITEQGGSGRLTGIFLRGTRTAQTLVLVDGVRIENSLGGGANLEFLPLASIERIEIVRGPSSALYGSSAVGGVIQIFTRRGAGTPVAPYASIGAGSRATAQLRAGVGGAVRDGATRFDLGVTADRSDGYEITRPGSPDHQADRDGHRQTGLSASLSQRLAARWDAGVDLLANRGRARYDGAFSSPEDTRLSFRTDNATAWLRGTPTGRWRTDLRIGRSTIGYDYAAFAFAPRVETRLASWQNVVQVGALRTLTGIETQRQQASGEGVDRVVRDTDSAFAGVDFELGRQLFKAHLRHDRFTSTPGDAAGLPRARDRVTTGTLAYGLRLADGWLARASYGSAFRVPTFDDLFNPFGSNPNLRPERSRGWDAALERQVGADRLRVTAFSNRIRDAIELDASFVPQNLDSARVRGVTVDGVHALGAFALRGSVTLQDTEGEAFDAATGAVTTRRLARRAGRFGTVGIDHRAGAWRGGLELFAQGPRLDTSGTSLPGYAVLDAHAAWRVAAGWELFARLSNLADRRYQTVQGYDGLPRTVFVGVRTAR